MEQTVYFDEPVKADLEAQGGVLAWLRIALVRMVLWATGCQAVVRCAALSKAIVRVDLSTSKGKSLHHFAVMSQVVHDWLLGQCTNRMVDCTQTNVQSLNLPGNLPFVYPNVPVEGPPSGGPSRTQS